MQLKDIAGLHRLPGLKIGVSDGFKRRDPAVAGDQRHKTGGCALIDELAQAMRDPGQARGVAENLAFIL